MSEPPDLTFALLPGLRADAETLEAKMRTRFGRFRRRLETMQRSGERADGSFAGHRMMVERAMASFEDEINLLKRRMALLETARIGSRHG
jgi:hypothetical protein